jgi:hypothetical protein
MFFANSPHPPPSNILQFSCDGGHVLISLMYRATSRTESSDLLSVLDQLDPDALPNSGVGLLGLDTDLLKNDALGVGGASKGRGLEGGSEETLLEA